VTLLALRAVGVMDARARGLVVQAVLPGENAGGRVTSRPCQTSKRRHRRTFSAALGL